MRPGWVAHYLGIPFAEKGRTRQGVDCYGLVRLIYQEQRSVELPSYTEGYVTTDDKQEIAALMNQEVSARWKEIPMPTIQLFDCLIFRVLGHPMHVGLALDHPWFIHAIKRQGQSMGKVWVERWDSIAWKHRVVAAVRWQGA